MKHQEEKHSRKTVCQETTTRSITYAWWRNLPTFPRRNKKLAQNLMKEKKTRAIYFIGMCGKSSSCAAELKRRKRIKKHIFASFWVVNEEEIYLVLNIARSTLRTQAVEVPVNVLEKRIVLAGLGPGSRRPGCDRTRSKFGAISVRKPFDAT